MEEKREEKAMEPGYNSLSDAEEKSEFAPWQTVQQDSAASAAAAASNSTNTNSAPEYFDEQDHSIKMLVVCSSPNSTFSRQKDIVKIHFPPKIEIIFLDGRKHKTFPQDLIVPDNYLDAIWFCGCNVIDDIFSSTFNLKRRWLSIFNNKLRFGGRVFFTEDQKFVKETCDGTIKNPSIFMDINCYKNHKLSGHLVAELTTFLKLFKKNEHLGFIYYTKKDKPGSPLWTNRHAKMKSSKRSRASADAAAGRSWAAAAFLPAGRGAAADAQRRSEVAAAVAAAEAGGLMGLDDGDYDNKEPLSKGWEQNNPDWAEAAEARPTRPKKRAWYDPRRYFKGSGRNTRRRKRRRRRRRTRRKTRRRKRVKKRTRRRRKKHGGMLPLAAASAAAHAYHPNFGQIPNEFVEINTEWVPLNNVIWQELKGGVDKEWIWGGVKIREGENEGVWGIPDPAGPGSDTINSLLVNLIIPGDYGDIQLNGQRTWTTTGNNLFILLSRPPNRNKQIKSARKLPQRALTGGNRIKKRTRRQRRKRASGKKHL